MPRCLYLMATGGESLKNAIAIYLRISLEDCRIKSVKNKESMSISNQRKLIMQYINSKDDLKNKEIFEVSDDGYSGTNFDRPGIKKILKMVEDGDIDSIIVKDFSRFGRNYIDVGHYIEHIFPTKGVRFISVNDGYDSIKSTENLIDTSVKNLIYSLYSKDLSQKIKAVKRAKMKNGEFVGSFAPYGYVRDQDNKGRFLIDADAAAVVKRIFNMAAEEGKSEKDIAIILNREKVPSPSVYKNNKGCSRRWNPLDSELVWNGQAVGRILSDIRYVGYMVSGKFERIIVGKNQYRKRDQESYFITENTHEAIIDKELFFKINPIKLKIIKTRKRRDNPFAGKIRCENCKKCLSRVNTKRPYFKCYMTGYINGNCYAGKIDEQSLVCAVNESVKKFIELDIIKPKQNLIQNPEIEKAQNLRALNKLKYDKKVLLEEYSLGKLDKESFIEKNNQYKAKIKELQALLMPRERDETNAEDVIDIVIKQFVKNIFVCQENCIRLEMNFLP